MKTRRDYDKEVAASKKVDGALMLIDIHEYVEAKRKPKAGKKTTASGALCMSNAQKRAYHASATEGEKESNEALKKEFERLRACILPKELIDTPDPKHGGVLRVSGGTAKTGYFRFQFQFQFGV